MIPVAHTIARSTLTMNLIWPWQQESFSVENSISSKKERKKKKASFNSNEEKFDYEQVAYPGQKLGVRRSQCVHWFVLGTH